MCHWPIRTVHRAKTEIETREQSLRVLTEAAAGPVAGVTSLSLATVAVFSRLRCKSGGWVGSPNRQNGLVT